MKHLRLLLPLLILLAACTDDTPPEPFGATPSERQRAWHELEYYAFVHFNMNTFSGAEWGHGEEPPRLFNPTQLDCRQWARVAKAAGMKGIVLTAKHHDGFCLWDSEYTDHDVASSPWRDGQGDVLRDLAEACREYDLKMGVYLSPWDQHSPVYGTDGYNAYFMQQLTEVLTNYGDIFEVWFDGAVGPEYKGQQPYDWEGFIATVREHQPDAVIFSDAGPDIRWVGTERGFANPTNWSTLNRDEYYPGTPDYLDLRSGNQRGTHWLPAEVDVSIRPGWYYHADEDNQVKSADHLELIYYNAVGRNANLLLNLPVDRRGLVHEHDSAALMQLRQRLDATFTDNRAAYAKTTASAVRGRSDRFGASHLNDGDPDTYWALNDGDTTGSFTLQWDEPQTFNVVEVEEYIPLGQRVETFAVDAWRDGAWQTIGKATSIGNKRWVRIPTTTTDRLRIRITDAMACPAIREVGVYHRPHDNYLLESKTAFHDRMQWWRDAKFGLFIHWGAYAVPAGRYRGETVSGVAEWIMYTAGIPVPEYEQYVRRFNPVDFDARAWARLAKAAGMEYMVITSKHHDGFSLWDSGTSTYDIIDAAPFGRDILRELKEACDAEGIRLGFYHSIMDWHHPLAGGETFPQYRDTYMKPQIQELVEGYDPAILWFDGEWIEEWSEPQGKDLYQYVRSLKPDILINNRVGKGRQGMQGMNREGEYVGDFGTPEQEVLDYGSAELDWESCMTMNNSWGYKVDDDNWKSATTLIHTLVDIAAKGGNYLLNVGPDARGRIPAPSVERLQAVGEWMDINGEAIKDTRMWNVWEEGAHLRYTCGSDGQVYAIALQWPGDTLSLKYVRPEPGSTITLLGHDSPLEWTFDEQDGLQVRLPPKTGAHAWVFRMEAIFPAVSAVPEFVNAKGEVVQEDIFSGSTTITLQTADPAATIYYTTDGTTPGPGRATRYAGPITLEETTELRAVALRPGALLSPVVKASFAQAPYNGVQLTNPYALQYTGGGPLGLVDGRRGSTDFKDGRWQGFEGVELEVVVDLGESRSIQRVETHFLQDLGAWIFPPQRVSMAVSGDGTNFQEVAGQSIATPRTQEGPEIHTIAKDFSARASLPTGRYVRIRARNVGICPAWHPGAGGKAWLFVDEVTVE